MRKAKTKLPVTEALAQLLETMAEASPSEVAAMLARLEAEPKIVVRDESKPRKVVAVRDLKAELGWPWSPAQTWRVFKAKNLKPFFVADSRLALIYRDEAEAILDEAVAMRGTRKAA